MLTAPMPWPNGCSSLMSKKYRALMSVSKCGGFVATLWIVTWICERALVSCSSVAVAK